MFKAKKSTFFLAAVICATLLPLPAQAQEGIASESLWKWQFVGDAQISPDGSKIAYVHISADEKKDNYRSAIWVADAATGKLRPLTAGSDASWREFSPRWSPDGKRLAFLSNRGGGAPQIYVLSFEGG